jgi:hypothetical protein
MLAHLRTEAYPVYRGRRYPPPLEAQGPAGAHSFERNVALIEEAKRRSGR